MSEKKEKRVETRSVKGAWDVKYKWRFDVTRKMAILKHPLPEKPR